MKKFEFNLQRLLEIRQDKEDEQRIELAKTSGIYQLALNKKKKVLDNLNVQRKKLSKETEGAKVSLIVLKEFDKLQVNSGLVVEIIDREIEEKRKIMEVELTKYTKLKQDRRAVEILKEKAQERHKKEMLLEEQTELDEIGKNIYLKNKKNH